MSKADVIEVEGTVLEKLPIAVRASPAARPKATVV